MSDNSQLEDEFCDFLFVRHGETDWNLEGRIQGHTDIPLNDTGRLQAKEAEAYLKNQPVSYIVTSPLSRAKETAQIIACQHDVAFYEEANLQEADFGQAQGQARQGWAADWRAGTYCPEEAETFVQFQTRVLKGLSSALTYQEASASGLPLIVGHGGDFTPRCSYLFYAWSFGEENRNHILKNKRPKKISGPCVSKDFNVVI